MNSFTVNISEFEIRELVHNLAKIQKKDLSEIEKSFSSQEAFLKRHVVETSDPYTNTKLYVNEAQSVLADLRCYERFIPSRMSLQEWKCKYLFTVAQEVQYALFSEYKSIKSAGYYTTDKLNPKKDSWEKWLLDCAEILDYIVVALNNKDMAKLRDGCTAISIRSCAPSAWCDKGLIK